MTGKISEDVISIVLRVGVVTSFILMALGLFWLLVTGNTGYPEEYFPTNVLMVFSGFRQFSPLTIIEMGLIILIVSPIISTSLLITAFILKGDYKYTLIAAYVLTILLISLSLAK